VWPLPPEEPKVKFVDILAADVDVKEPSFLSVLFGEEVGSALIKPYGAAVDKEGRLYVTDLGRVFIFDKKNHRLEFIGDEFGSGKLRVPVGIAIAADKVYVTDVAADRVFVYNTGGKFITAIGAKAELEGPSGIAVNEKKERLYVADTKKHNVRVYSLDGKLLFTIGARGSDAGKLNFPTNIALDGKGNLYVVDTGNFRVQVFDPEGKFIRAIGQVGDKPGDFTRPKGIAVDSEDHIYVIDAAFQNIQIFNTEGQLLLVVGEGGGGLAQFSVPSGMTIDSDDKIYVVDQLNARVQVFQYLSEKWKKKQAAQPAK
ncbi:MAG: 6-bladed beta-propeller, partial [Nitrospirae bacterium]